ncbi:rNA polymerase sigma-43 factor [Prevotella sp. CAG:1092]|nr:rNA polymerase sigma-43 factor [Prevotella sp. CAG:1092]
MPRTIKWEYVKELDKYFSEIKHFKTLSRQEERALGMKIQRGDKSALNKLVNHNLKFVVSIAKKYRDRGVPFEDLISEGNMGLYHAAEKYDGRRETKFITYAVWWIKNSINEIIKDYASNNEINVDDFIFDKKKSVEYHQELINEEFEEELNNIQSRNDSVEELLKCLQERERKIVTMFFGLKGTKEMNLDEIGQSMSLSMERVRQIKDVALIKLKSNVLMMNNDFFKEIKELC